MAIVGCEDDKMLYLNWSVVVLGMGLVEEVLWDVVVCVCVDEMWAKGYYRLGCVFMSVFESGKVVVVFRCGLEFVLESVDMKEWLEEVEVLYEDECECVVVEMRVVWRNLAYKFR